MCGIAGIVGADPQWKADESTVRRMCRTLIHRGPDDEGVYVNGPAALGMRRLSIIDLASGHQPISNEDQSVWVVLNGEIYNFPELRAGLKESGHRFSSNSDTEVIVHLYEEQGVRCVEKLRGMFALALYDETHRRLLLARDRFGKKPLYYSLHRGRLIFGSEIKAVLAAAPELAQVNQEAILQYLYFGFVPDPNTAFSPIQKLAPGHYLELHNGKIAISRYWDLPRYSMYSPASEEVALDELEAQLEEAVRIRLMSDVPLGALLSGGVDSSTVVALMRRSNSGPVKTFSIAFREQEFNEGHHARAVARRFETDHMELTVEPRIRETLEILTRSLEEPFGDSSIVPQFYVSQITRKHVTVALSGDGGDELFAGYSRYQTHMSRRFADWLPASLGRWYRGLVHPWLPNGLLGKRLLFNLSLSSVDRYLDSLSYFSVERKERDVFTSDFLDWARGRPSPYESFRQIYFRAPTTEAADRLTYLDIHTNLAGDILTKVDRASMANSLEVRAPLLDHVVAEWVAGLSSEWKIRNGHGKYLLRKLALRLGVPASVLDRPKRGFALPLVDWLQGELKDLTRLLVEPRALQRGYWNRSGVERLLDEHFRLRRDHSGAIWLLLMLELWHRNFLEQPEPHESSAAALRISAALAAPGPTPATTTAGRS